MAAVLCHVLFRGIFCLWATAAELLHYLFVIWVNWTFKLCPQQHREYQRSRLFPKLRESLVITRRFFHIAPEVHAGRWSVGEQGGRGKWFRRLQQHSETTSSACLVQRHQDCPFSLLRPRSAASSLPQTLRVERVCFPLALTHTHTAPTHPCAHPSFWALGNRANTSFSSSATPSSVCTRSSLHHTHTHTHTQSTWDFLRSSCALPQRFACVGGRRLQSASPPVPRSSDTQLELAVMGLSSSRSRGAGLSCRLP